MEKETVKTHRSDWYNEYIEETKKVAILEYQLRSVGITPYTKKDHAKIVMLK